MHRWDNKVSRDARVIHLINQFISLKDEDIRKNNKILQEVLGEVIQLLKAKDSFFRDYFQNIVFAGSYYKGTKVGNPDEFDLNIVIGLPVNYGSIQFEEDLPGFTKLRLSNDSFLPKWNDHKKLLSTWTTEGNGFPNTLMNGVFAPIYLRPDKFRRWMESLFSNIPKYSSAGYELKVSKRGPAFMLTVSGLDLSNKIDVDLVPVLEFNNDISLKRASPEGRWGWYWYAVPKPLEENTNLPDVQWRISFYSLEKTIFKMYQHGYVKPVIRQMKKLRDKYQWNFASYFIETLFLKEIKADPFLCAMGEIEIFVHVKNQIININSIPYTIKSRPCVIKYKFIPAPTFSMLGRVKKACESHKILNYWDSGHNLIAHLPKEQLNNMKGHITRIIKQIENDPLSIASFILTTDELAKIQDRINAIRTGRAYDNISSEPLKLEENESTSWCSIQ